MSFLAKPRPLAPEEGDEQRGDMGAVDIGVGHHDDLLVAQVVLAELGIQVLTEDEWIALVGG